MRTTWIKTGSGGFMEIFITDEADWARLRDRMANMSAEERISAAAHYMAEQYRKAFERVCEGARGAAEGFESLAETLDILHDPDTMEAIEEGRADSDDG